MLRKTKRDFKVVATGLNVMLLWSLKRDSPHGPAVYLSRRDDNHRHQHFVYEHLRISVLELNADRKIKIPFGETLDPTHHIIPILRSDRIFDLHISRKLPA